MERANAQSQKTASLEDALSAKADELNDLRRKTLAFEKQVGVLETEIRQIRNEHEGLKRENSTLKAKLLENGQDIRRAYEGKEVESKRQTQRLSEDLAAVSAELREEKRSGARWQSELQNLKGELRRYEELAEQAKRREGAVTEELSQLRSAYENACDDNERLKSEVKYKATMYTLSHSGRTVSTQKSMGRRIASTNSHRKTLKIASNCKLSTTT